MEAVGFTGSLVALIEAAAYTAKVTRRTYRRFYDAPQILEAIEIDLCMIHAGLQSIEQLHSFQSDEIVCAESRQAIETALKSAQVTLDSIGEMCHRMNHESRRDRIRWAVLDHSGVEKRMQELKAIQYTLRSLFHILGLQEQSRMSLEIASVKQMVMRLSEKTETGHERRQDTPALRLPHKTPSHEQLSLMCISKVVNVPFWLRRFGIEFSMVKLTSRDSQDSLEYYSVAFKMPALMSYYALTGELTIKKFHCSPSFRLMEPSRISFGRVVSTDSVAMGACVRGDLFTLKQQLKMRSTTLNDITSRNWSLMTLAVMSGNVEIVHFLLDNGIHVDSTFGERQTSPLQWALDLKQLEIAKVLVSRGANVNHISTLGWSPLFYCWPEVRSGQAVMLDQIDLLSEAGPIDLDVVDKWGWTVLQRVAAYGTALEVLRLVELGADTMVRHYPLGWPAIFHAVFFGNRLTLLELMKHHDPSIITEADERGWTLLHVAAAAGHRDIIRCLLELGSDHRAVSMPFFSHMPQSIYGKRCTPADVAGAHGQEQLDGYEKLLDELGLAPKRQIVGDDYDDKDEIFWDAMESLPSSLTA